MATTAQERAKELAQIYGNTISKKDIEKARKNGYTDTEIYDAAQLGGKIKDGAQGLLDAMAPVEPPSTDSTGSTGSTSGSAGETSTSTDGSQTTTGTTLPGVYQSINDWAANNKDNDLVSGMVNDLYYNSASAQLQTQSDIDYIKQLSPLALNYQQQSQNIMSAADITRMTAEGAITNDLLRVQGDYSLAGQQIEADSEKYGYDAQVRGKEVEADALKYGYDTQAQASMYGADKELAGIGLQADAAKYGADQALAGKKVEAGAAMYGYDKQLAGVALQTDAQRYGYDKQAQASMYGADRDLEAAKYQADSMQYGYDQQLAGVKYGADKQLEATRYSKDSDERVAFGGYASAERQIGLQGDENRKTLAQQTDETLRLRADARGAIKRSGARFYG